MFLSSEDVQNGTKPLGLCWIRLFPDIDTKQLVAAFSHALMVFERTEAGTLRLLFRQGIHAPILEMHVIPREAPLPERLLLLLDECNKLSVLECINYRFVNVQLHHFPEQQYRHELTGPDSIDQLGRVAVDPEGRCLGLRLFRNYLAVVPQPVDAVVEEIDRLPSWVVSFYDMDERFRNVTRLCFLPGYIEPTLALLGTKETGTTARTSSVKDQTWFALVTCQLLTQKFNTIYYLEALPNDLREMVAMARPTGGVLAYGANSVVHLEQGSPGIGLALNLYSTRLSSFKYTFPPTTQYLLATTVAICLDEDHVLFGNGLLCRLKKGGRFVNKMELTQLERMTSFHFTLLNPGNLLVAHDNDELALYQVHSKKSTTAQTTPSSVTATSIDDTDIYLQELAQDTQHSSGKVELSRIASIACTSQVQDMALGREQTAVVTESGSLYIYPKHWPTITRTSFEIPGSQGIWTIEVGTKHLLVSSTATATLVLLKDQDRIKEVESSGFYLEGPTLHVARFREYILQVTYDKALLLSTNYSLVSSLDARFIKAAVYGEHVALLEESGEFAIYAVNGEAVLEKVNVAKGIKTFDFDHKLNALWAVDNNGVLSCLVNPYRDLVFVNANFTALPPILSNHLQNAPKVKAATFAVHEIKVLRDMLVVLAENQVVAYRILDNVLIKVYSQRVSKGEYSVFPNSEAGLLVFLGPESFILNIDALASVPLASQYNSISFLSGKEFIGVQEGKVTINQVDARYKWGPVMGLALHSKLASGLSRVLYHPASECFLVTIREPAEWKLPTDDYSAISDQLDADLPDKALLPMGHEYKIGLVSSQTLGLIDTFTLREYETALELKLSTLDTKQTSSGKKAFVTVGTALNKGEDRPVRGRLIVLDLVDVVPDPDKPETNRKLRLLAFQEVKGPVLTHCELDGCLLVGLGSKIIIHALENDDSLTGIAFVDSGVASISSAVLKNYFCLGDVNLGLSFFGFQKEPPKIAALGKDQSHHGCVLELRCVEFVVQDGQVMMVGGDRLGSLLHFWMYAPLDRRTGSGQKLLYLGCMRLNSPPIAFIRQQTPTTDKTLEVFVLCQDGSIKRLTPIGDTLYRKGMALSARMGSQLLTPQAGGLLPRAVNARPFGADPGVPHPTFSSLVDVTFNRQQVLDLSVAQQGELAKVTNLEVSDLFL